MKRIDKPNEELICYLYEEDSLSIYEISKIVNWSSSTVRNILKRNEIKFRNASEAKRKYKLKDENVFKKIDTEAKAYFLGLLYADGCVCQSSLLLCLSEKDKEILNELNNWLFEKPIELNFLESSELRIKGNEKVYFRQPRWELRFGNKFLTQDLINLGCFPNKSLTLKFPTEEQVPAKFLKDFIRGYFDGDGWICANKRTKQFGVISSKEFCEKLRIFLEKELQIRSSIKKQGKMYVLKVYHSEGILNIFDFFYKENPKFYMKRRKNAFISAMKFIKSPLSKDTA